jgi:hypothetical protein
MGQGCGIVTQKMQRLMLLRGRHKNKAARNPAGRLLYSDNQMSVQTIKFLESHVQKRRGLCIEAVINVIGIHNQAIRFLKNKLEFLICSP